MDRFAARRLPDAFGDRQAAAQALAISDHFAVEVCQELVDAIRHSLRHGGLAPLKERREHRDKEHCAPSHHLLRGLRRGV